MHGKDAAGHHFTMLPYAEVPRLDPHHIVKHELKVQAALHINLQGTLTYFTIQNYTCQLQTKPF